MEKRIILWIVTVFMCGYVQAQKLMPSFKDDFLNKMYTQADPSIREELKKTKTPCSEYFFLAKDMSQIKKSLSKVVRKSQKNKHQLLCYEAEDFQAFLCYDENTDNIQFEFFYVTPDNRICCTKLLENTGSYRKVFETKSRTKYVVSHEWGFLEITQNYLDFLNCYYDYSKDCNGEFVIVPFEGTNRLVWKQPSEGAYLPAF